MNVQISDFSGLETTSASGVFGVSGRQWATMVSLSSHTAVNERSVSSLSLPKRGIGTNHKPVSSVRPEIARALYSLKLCGGPTIIIFRPEV
jgi:hypothetical protein